MASPFVTLPGTAGNYFDSDGINKIGADTANLQQGVGEWASGSGLGGTIAQSTDLTPVFGNSHGKGTPGNGATSVSLVTSGGVSGYPVSASTVYTVLLSFASASDDVSVRLRMSTFDAGGSSLGSQLVNDYVVLSSGVWVVSSGQFTTPASTAFISFNVDYRRDSGTWNGSQDVYWDAAMIALGTVSAFVPSLRIVGDDYSALDVALDDYTPSASEVLWDDGATKCTLDTAGDFTFEMWGDASTALSPTTALVNGRKYTISLSGVQSTGVVTFAIDGVTQTTDTLTPGSPTYADLFLGASTTPGDEAAGDFYTYERRDGLAAGPLVRKFDAVDVAKATL